MKILHVFAGSLSGGAARGAYWLHLGLKEKNIESRILLTKTSGSPDEVQSVAEGFKGALRRSLYAAIDYIPSALYLKRLPLRFSSGIVGFDIRKHPWYDWADVIHFHWINMGMINLSLMRKINKPVVWTLRDMWAFTGGCHYALTCERYRDACGKCPMLGSRSQKDLSFYLLKRKKRLLPGNIKYVCISNWLTSCARASSVLRDKSIQTISNCINTKEYFPVNKSEARKALQLPEDKKIILAGAQNIKHLYKGFQLLPDALNSLPDEYDLLFFGKMKEKDLHNLRKPHRTLGFLENNKQLRLAYSAADVYLAPSIQEAFGKTIAEAMACGTPVVCFDTTGPRDIVDHKINGYRAKPSNIKDFTAGINWVMEDKTRHEKLCRKATEKITSSFSITVCSAQYINLYKKITG